MTTPALKEAVDYMNAQRATNTCDKFKYTVKIGHRDGSLFLLENAYFEEKVFGQFEMLLVYTEHCGYFPFYLDDLEYWRTYTINNL